MQNDRRAKMWVELDAVSMNTIVVRRQPYERLLILLRTVYFVFPDTSLKTLTPAMKQTNK